MVDAAERAEARRPVSPRTTGVLLLVAAALCAFVWFYEIEGEAHRKGIEESEKRLFAGLEPEDVVWVALTTGDGVAVRAERREGSWEIVEPLRFPGEPRAFDGIASALAEVKSQAVFDAPQAAAVYGLDDPAREVRFEADGEERALRTGDEAPMGSDRYARVVGEERVHTVPSWRAQALVEDFDALRDKRVLDFDPDAVMRIVAAWPGGRVELARDGEAWRVEVPIEGAADAETVDDVLSDLALLRAEGFVDAPPPDADTGLAEPGFRIELGLAAVGEGEAGDRRTLALAVGDVTEGGARLVRAGRDSLFRVPGARLDELPRDVSAYRFKRLADFAVGEARSVELAFSAGDGAPVTITATRGDSGWSSEPEAMAPEQLARLVEEIDGLTADAILAEGVGPDELEGLGLDPPAAAFVVRGEGEAPLAEVRLGVLQGSQGIVAQSGDNPQVFRLGPELAEHLPVSLVAFRNRFLAVEAPEPDVSDPEFDAWIESLEESP